MLRRGAVIIAVKSSNIDRSFCLLLSAPTSSDPGLPSTEITWPVTRFSYKSRATILSNSAGPLASIST
jgi:hypothetical protein